MFIGESFIGSGANAAHINVMVGPRTGPVGSAWAGALSSPTKGHLPFMVVLQPGVPVKPKQPVAAKSARPGVFIATVPGKPEDPALKKKPKARKKDAPPA